MQIGFDISVLRIAQAGVLRYTHDLLEELIAQDDAHAWTLLDVLALNRDKPMQPLAAFNAPNARVVYCQGLERRYLSMHPSLRHGARHTVASAVDQLLDQPWALAATAAMGLQLRSALRHVDVFHSSDQFFYAPPGAASVITIYDLTTSVHPEWHVGANTAMHSAKERFAIEQADHVIAISEATKRDAMRYLQIPEQRITVVYGAADERFKHYSAEQIKPTLERYQLQHGSYILSIGTVEPRKNYVRLIEAYALLRHKLQPNVAPVPPLIIAGGFGWLYEDILATPEKLGVGQHVRFLGKVPDADLVSLLNGATAFVYPSLYEGFGLPVLEALACGTPTIASNSTSLPEVMGDAGLYCDPYDAGSIAQRIAELLNNPAYAAQLGRAGLARAGVFSWQRAAQETLAVYAHAADAKRFKQKGRQ